MRRKLPGESVQKMLLDYFDRNKPLRRQCRRWAADNISRLKAAKPIVPNHGNDRRQDNWTPLFAIAELVGGGWHDRVLRAYQAVTDGNDDDDDTIGPMILHDIKAIFDEKGVARICSEDLVDALIGLEERPWAEWKHGKQLTKNSLARLLKPFKIRPGDIRFGPEKKKGYEREKFEDAWKRYLLTPESPISSETTRQASHGKGFSPISIRDKEEDVSLQKTLKASGGAGCRVVSVQEGGKAVNGYPPGLFDAATTACSGLKLTAGEFIAQLEPEDYQEIVSNPTMAKVAAQSMTERK
jgi:hypothetical protein